MHMHVTRDNRKLLTVTLTVSTMIMLGKFVAYFATQSTAILSDALESIVNVAAGALALYSYRYAHMPKDRSHPYGHGKMEFVSAAIEGALIAIAGAFAVGKGSYHLFYPNQPGSIPLGLLISALAMLANFAMGLSLKIKGKNSHSMALEADGRHLMSDAYTSLGLLLGLAAYYWTGKVFIDNLMAILFGALLFREALHVLRKAFSGVMDEADPQFLEELAEILQNNRKPLWIDVHNLKVQKMGAALHIDLHLTLPWYMVLQDAEEEVDRFRAMVRSHLPEREIEFSIHTDPCLPQACPSCQMPACFARKRPFRQQIPWSTRNLASNQRHHLKK